MIDPRDLNARGVRLRQVFDVLRTMVTAPQPAAELAFAWAALSNLLREMEQDAGVPLGYFGSAGAELQEINPFDGTPMPPAISREPPPTIVLANPSLPPAPPPPAPPTS